MKDNDPSGIPVALPKRGLANHELVVLATYIAGGQATTVDTEDIAIKANELAPGRFSWRKYKNQVNIEAVRKRLWDATKAEKGGYLIGSEKTGWRLTKAGFDFAKSKLNALGPKPATKQRTSQNERVTQNRELKRLQHEEAFLKFSNGLKAEITKSEAERFFRIDDYVTGKSRTAKIERFKIISSEKPDLLLAVKFLATLVKES